MCIACVSIVCCAELGLKSEANIGSDYIAALTAVDHLMQAWQSGDTETGVSLLTEHAKKNTSREDLDELFSSAQPKAYEIGRGRMLKAGRYEFPLALADRHGHSVRRHFATVVVINTGKNGWAVDKLPK